MRKRFPSSFGNRFRKHDHDRTDMKIDDNGRLTIPRELQERFGLHPGTSVEIEVSRDGILLKPMDTHRLGVAEWLKNDHGDEMVTLTTDTIMRLVNER